MWSRHKLRTPPLQKNFLHLKGVCFFFTIAGSKRRLLPKSALHILYVVSYQTLLVQGQVDTEGLEKRNLNTQKSVPVAVDCPKVTTFSQNQLRIIILGGLERSREVRNCDQNIFQSQK